MYTVNDSTFLIYDVEGVNGKEVLSSRTGVVRHREPSVLSPVYV